MAKFCPPRRPDRNPRRDREHFVKPEKIRQNLLTAAAKVVQY